MPSRLPLRGCSRGTVGDRVVGPGGTARARHPGHGQPVGVVAAAGLALGLARARERPLDARPLRRRRAVWQAFVEVLTPRPTSSSRCRRWRPAGCLAAAAPRGGAPGRCWRCRSARGADRPVTWPVAMVRELDSRTCGLHWPRRRPAADRRRWPSPPPTPARRLLVFDWLLGAAGDDRGRLWRRLAMAFGIVCCARALAGGRRPAFLNGPPWIGLGRAAGTLSDANARGAGGARSGRCSRAASGRGAATPSWRRAGGLGAGLAGRGDRQRLANVVRGLDSAAPARGVERPAGVAGAGGSRAAPAAVVARSSLLRAPGGKGHSAPPRDPSPARPSLAGGPRLLALLVPRRLRTDVDGDHRQTSWVGVGPGVFGTVVGGYPRRKSTVACRAKRPELVAASVGRARSDWRAAGLCLLALAAAAGLAAWRSPARPGRGRSSASASCRWSARRCSTRSCRCSSPCRSPGRATAADAAPSRPPASQPQRAGAPVPYSALPVVCSTMITGCRTARTPFPPGPPGRFRVPLPYDYGFSGGVHRHGPGDGPVGGDPRRRACSRRRQARCWCCA